MLEVYRRGVGVQVDDAKRATTQAWSAIRDGYARSQSPAADLTTSSMTKARSTEVWPRSSLGGVSRQIVLVASGLARIQRRFQCRAVSLQQNAREWLRHYELAPFLLGPVRLGAV